MTSPGPKAPAAPTEAERSNTDKEVYVKRISKEVTAAELQAIFAPCGTVASVNLKGMLKGQFAFVAFTTEEAAKKALQLSGTELRGEKLVIEPRLAKSGHSQEPSPDPAAREKDAPAAAATTVVASDAAAPPKPAGLKIPLAAPPPYVPMPLPGYPPLLFPMFPLFPPPPPPLATMPPSYRNPAHYYGVSNAAPVKDATKYAAVDQRLPVVLIYGAPCSGCTTISRLLAEDQRAICFSAATATKDPMPWVSLSNILTKLQQTLSLAPQPLHGLVIDWSLKSKVELAYLIDWLTNHNVPLNAAFHVDDQGGAIKRALETATNEPDYQIYLRQKFDRAAEITSDFDEFFAAKGVLYRVPNAPGDSMEKVITSCRAILAQSRANRKSVDKPPEVSSTSFLRPVLDCDEYRTAMEALCATLGSNRKGAIQIPSGDGCERSAADDWGSYLRAPTSEGGPALPVVRAQVGQPGLIFYHAAGVETRERRRLYFVPRGQALLYTLPTSYWTFGPVAAHCVALGSYVTEEGPDSYLLYEDVFAWEGQSVFGRRYESRIAYLAQERSKSVEGQREFKSASLASFPEIRHWDPNHSFQSNNSLGAAPDAAATEGAPKRTGRLIGLIHRAISLQQLAAIVSDPAEFEALQNRLTYKWAKREAVVLFDAAAPTALSAHGLFLSFREEHSLKLVFRLGDKVSTSDGGDVFQLLAYSPAAEGKKGENAVLPIPEHTLEVPATSGKRGVAGVDCVVATFLAESRKWKFEGFRPDRLAPENWPYVQKTGVLLPPPKRLLTLDDWLRYVQQCAITLPSKAVQMLLEKVGLSKAPAAAAAAREGGRQRRGKKPPSSSDAAREGTSRPKPAPAAEAKEAEARKRPESDKTGASTTRRRR